MKTVLSQATEFQPPIRNFLHRAVRERRVNGVSRDRKFFNEEPPLNIRNFILSLEVELLIKTCHALVWLF